MFLAPTPFFTATLQRAPGGLAGNFHTIKLMRAAVNAAKVDPVMIQKAIDIIYLQPQMNEDAEVSALFEYVRDRIRYVRDVVGIETLADPRMTMLRMVGDCDDQSALLATLLECVGYPTRFVMAGYHSRDFEHVYVQALAREEWVSMDPTERYPLGWEPPDPVVIWHEGI